MIHNSLLFQAHLLGGPEQIHKSVLVALNLSKIVISKVFLSRKDFFFVFF